MALSRAGDRVLETGRKEIDGWVQFWVHARPAPAGVLWNSGRRPRRRRPAAIRCLVARAVEVEIGEFLRKLAPQAGLEPATLRLTGGKRNVSRPLLRCAG